MANNTFAGLCVLALESRRAREIGKLIANLGGVPIVAPSVREVSLESNQEALEFARRLSAREVDIVIFTTGVGVKALASAVEKVCPRDELAGYLNELVVVARGPKPTAALRESGVRVSLTVPEPNTWRDLLTLLDESKNTFPIAGRRIAVQEYGVANADLSAGLEERGATVFPVKVYQWALPEDIGPLQRAVESIIEGEIHVLLVASSIQIRHLFDVAEKMGKSDALHEALSRVVITSIGPLTSEELRSRGLNVDIECTRPKMGFLVQEAAEKSAEILRQKSGHPKI
jgi:uroporphyrinogen-III synthase